MTQWILFVFDTLFNTAYYDTPNLIWGGLTTITPVSDLSKAFMFFYRTVIVYTVIHFFSAL